MHTAKSYQSKFVDEEEGELIKYVQALDLCQGTIEYWTNERHIVLLCTGPVFKFLV